MHTRRTRARLAATILAIVGLAPFMGAQAASATTGQLPFNDLSTSGGIAFCDRAGKAMTSGDVRDIPFVWSSVSTTAAPPGYFGPYGKATLYAFQPRENVDPALWSGKQLTGSAHYTNPRYPMVQATNGDHPLADFTTVAPLWQGLVQIRMYFTNVDTTPHSDPYPATVIRVSGTKWTVVAGGSAPCNAGTSVSNESGLLGSARLPSSAPTYRPTNPSGTPYASIVGSPASGDGSNLGAESSVPSSGVPMIAWLGLIALPIAGVAGGLLVGRRSERSRGDSALGD